MKKPDYAAAWKGATFGRPRFQLDRELLTAVKVMAMEQCRRAGAHRFDQTGVCVRCAHRREQP